MNDKRISQAERSEQREEALRQQEQAMRESRIAARHRKPEENAPDELQEKIRKQRQIILKIILAFLVAGIIYAIGREIFGSKPASTKRSEPVEEAGPSDR